MAMVCTRRVQLRPAAIFSDVSEEYGMYEADALEQRSDV